MNQESPDQPINFVLAHLDGPHSAETLESMNRVVARTFFLTRDKGVFWRRGTVEKLKRAIPVLMTHEHPDAENIAMAIANAVSPWAGEGSSELWVIYLPPLAHVRPSDMITKFVQFVLTQPPHIEYVRTIRKLRQMRDTTLIRFGSEELPSVIHPQAAEENTYEVTACFSAWRLKSSGVFDIASNIAETAFWPHAEMV